MGTMRIDRNRWSLLLVDLDWRALHQTLYDGGETHFDELERPSRNQNAGAEKLVGKCGRVTS